MSEYWVSTKKYWCKHCSTFVKDSNVSRQQHDATPRHQGALKRFLRELHKSKEKEAHQAEAIKREAERLNNLNNPDYKPPPRPNAAAGESKGAGANAYISEEQRKRNMDELAAMGVAMPESYRKEHAMMGEWEQVRVITPPPVIEDDEENEDNEKKPIVAVAGGEDRNTGEKRKLDEEEEGEREIRKFKFQEKGYPVDDGGAVVSFSFKKKGKQKPKPRVESGGSDEADIKQETEVKEEPEVKKEEAEVKQKPSNEDNVDSATVDEAGGVKQDAVSTEIKTEEPEESKVPVDKVASSDVFQVAFKVRRARNNRKGG